MSLTELERTKDGANWRKVCKSRVFFWLVCVSNATEPYTISIRQLEMMSLDFGGEI